MLKHLIFSIFLLYSSTGFGTESPSGQCWTKLRVHREYPEKQPDTYNIDLSVEFLSDNRVVFFAEGDVNINSRAYKISRVIFFNYERLDGDSYVLSRKVLDKQANDDYPEDYIFSQFGFDDDSPDFHIQQFNNDYLFINAFSPVFLCKKSPG